MTSKVPGKPGIFFLSVIFVKVMNKWQTKSSVFLIDFYTHSPHTKNTANPTDKMGRETAWK